MHTSYALRNELVTVESFLSIYPLGSMQITKRDGATVHQFHASFFDKKLRKLEGFIWQPNQPDIQYEIDLGRNAVPTIQIILGSGNVVVDVEKVKSEIPQLASTARVRERDFVNQKKGGGGSGKKGYYLKCGIAKQIAKQRFENALLEGIGSRRFIEFCIPRNLTMYFVEGANQET